MMLETREQLEELLKNGVSDIEAAAEIADKDPMRPRYHFHSPSQWMTRTVLFIIKGTTI